MVLAGGLGRMAHRGCCVVRYRVLVSAGFLRRRVAIAALRRGHGAGRPRAVVNYGYGWWRCARRAGLLSQG